jgi:hypothetical protein
VTSACPTPGRPDQNGPMPRNPTPPSAGTAVVWAEVLAEVDSEPAALSATDATLRS